MSLPKLTLVSFALCPYVHRSTTMLHEKGVAFEVKYVELTNKPDWFLAISPRGKVPVLEVDGTPLFESAVINEYIDETHLPRLAPADPLERARERAWIEVTNDLFVAQYKVTFGTEDDFNGGRAASENALASFEKAFRGPLFSGESFGLVDAAIAPIFYRIVLLEAKTKVRILSEFPRVQAWARALATRPSVVKGQPPRFDELYLAKLAKNGSHFARAYLGA